MPFVLGLGPQIAAKYRKAVFDRALRARVPEMRVVAFTGDATVSFSIPLQWEIEEDDQAAGGGFVRVL